MADQAALPPATTDPRRARLQQQPPTSSSPAPSTPAPTYATVEPVEDTAMPSGDAVEPTEPATVLPDEPQLQTATTLSPPTQLYTLPAPTLKPAEAAPASAQAEQEEVTASVGQTQADVDEAARKAEMEAAIAATLAMESEAAPEEVAGAVAEANGRSGEGTPALYGATGASDVPAAVATPPLPSSSGASQTKPQKAQSSLSRVAQLTARVERDPLDGEAQLALLQDAVQKGDLERTREVYEKFLTVFPDAAQQWIGYCDLELAHNLFTRVEDLFARCLRSSTSVDLWRFYLDYIRRVNPVDPANLEQAKQARSVIASAFEFALGHVGFDRRAGEIWGEYIAFLKEGQTRGTWEEQQKMDALRKAFTRAVQTPINNVEAIWQDYNAFENNLSKMTAKKFIAELSPSYMTARKTLRELRAQHDNLPTPTLPSRPKWSSSEDRDGLERWKRYLAYEESNPLEIEDPQMLHQRIGFAYRKALANLRFYPEVWYLSANFHLRVGLVNEGRKLLRDGMTANPASLLLAYTLADLEEGKQDLTACYTIYDSLIEHLYARITQLEASVEADIVEALAAKEAEKAEAVKAEDGGEGGGGAEKAKEEEEEDTVETREKKAQEVEELKKGVRERRQPEIDGVKQAAANVWITKMRFARRSDGVKQARSVFLKAKKSPHLAWQVVEASAHMEMYWNSDVKVATNVFELGLKLFSAEPEYVLRYLEFLLQQNNSNNARALFERTVALIEPAKAKPIWDRMAQFEFQCGDYLASQKMARRYAEAFPETPTTVRFAQQHKYAGLEDAFANDLGTSFAKQIKDERRGRSASPTRRAKRNLDEPEGGVNGNEQDGGDVKRARLGVSPSPAPSSQPGWDAQQQDFRRVPQAAPALNRAQPYMLDPAGHNVAVLPDAVVFFLSLLPPASAFNGPHLNPANIMDIIGTTILPGSAPGPGLPGERLGIPPRPKPQRPQGYGGAPPPGPPATGWGGRRY
ncbi:hypothetical protein JCM8547_009132 [Rhodosporidiobolus lusitaniae]